MITGNRTGRRFLHKPTMTTRSRELDEYPDLRVIQTDLVTVTKVQTEGNEQRS